MKTIHLLLVSGTLLLHACSSESETSTSGSLEQDSADAKTSGATQQPETIQPEPPKTVKLDGKFLKEADYGSSLYLVQLTIDGKTTVIDTVNACETILPKAYAQYDIPVTAKSACGGWWAGGGDYFYATIENDAVVVYQGWQDEGQTDTGYHWQPMKLKQ